MTKRFENATMVELRAPGGEAEVAVAMGFRLRLVGLTRLKDEEVEPLLFRRCSSIHTFGMKTPIDVVWIALEGNGGGVLAVVESLQPRKWARGPRGAAPHRALAALELASGEAARLGLEPGARVSFL